MSRCPSHLSAFFCVRYRAFAAIAPASALVYVRRSAVGVCRLTDQPPPPWVASHCGFLLFQARCMRRAAVSDPRKFLANAQECAWTLRPQPPRWLPTAQAPVWSRCATGLSCRHRAVLGYVTWLCSPKSCYNGQRKASTVKRLQRTTINNQIVDSQLFVCAHRGREEGLAAHRTPLDDRRARPYYKISQQHARRVAHCV